MKRFCISLFVSMLFANILFAKTTEADSVKVQNIGEVVIYASRSKAKLKELPAKVEVITKKVISQSSAKDLAYLLKANTAIDLVQYPGFLSGIGMRGFAPGTNNKYVTVFVDGIPAGTSNMATLSLSGTQQVEVLKGPFSSLYGSQAMGGIINIVPVQSKGDITGSVNLSYGSYKTLNGGLTVGGKVVGGLSFDLDAYYHDQGDDFKIGKENFYDNPELYETILDKKSYGATKKHTKEKSMGGKLRLGYDFTKNWSVDIHGNFFKTDDLATGGDFWNKYGPSFKDMELYGTHLGLKGKLRNHTITFNPYYSKEYNGYLNIKTKKATYKSKIQTYGFQLQDNLTLGKHKLTFGMDNQQAKKVVESATADGVAKAPSSPGYVNGTLGAFAQGIFKLFDDRINLSAGARYDYMNLTLEADKFLKNKEQTENHSILNPNVGLKIKIDEYTNIHSSFGTAFITPDAFQKAGKYEKINWKGEKQITQGNPDLKSETSQTFDIGVGYNNMTQGVKFDITYFQTKHKDFISSYTEMIGGIMHKLFKNDQEAKMKGLEVMASYDFGALVDYDFSLKAYFNATLMLEAKVLVANFVTKEKSWIDTHYVRKQNINFGLDFTTQEKWNVKLNARYMGSRKELNWNGGTRPNLAKIQPQYSAMGLIKTPQFMLFDASVYYNLTQNFTVGFNGNNLLDENYTEKDGYNMPGRNFLAKVIFNF